MDARLFEAAQNFRIDATRELKDLTAGSQVTPNGDTVLHVVAQFCDSIDRKDARKILQMEGSTLSLLTKRNADRATSLHLAARHGNYNLACAIIENAKTTDKDLELESGITPLQQLLRMMTASGDTALHETVRSPGGSYRGHIVKLLVDEDPELVNLLNGVEESPLYISVEKEYYDVAKTILGVCTKRIAYTGPKGRTALHAAAIGGLAEMARELLSKDSSLNEVQDDSGYTALHYASAYGAKQVVIALLCNNKDVTYIPAREDNNMTALHIASSRGHVNVMKEIIRVCPDCYAMVTSRGQNILHIAFKCQQKKSMIYIVKQRWVGKIINQKDQEGNTSLHSYAASPMSHVGSDLAEHPEADINALNKKFMTPLDVLESSEMGIRTQRYKKRELRRSGAKPGHWNGISIDHQIKKRRSVTDTEDLRKRADTHVIIAALIATIAFTAGFSILTGYDGVQGPNNPNLKFSRRAAFYGFVILDIMAMYSSVYAIFLHFNAASSKRRPTLLLQVKRAARHTLFSMAAVVLAFSMCLYAVFQQSAGIAVTQLATGFIMSCLISAAAIYKEVRSIKLKTSISKF